MTVVVYGPIGRQANLLADALPGVVVWPRRRQLVRLDFADYVVLWVSFLSHRETLRAERCIHKNRLRYVSGGMTTLRRAVTLLLEEEENT